MTDVTRLVCVDCGEVPSMCDCLGSTELQECDELTDVIAELLADEHLMAMVECGTATAPQGWEYVHA